MPRLYASSQNISGNKITIADKDQLHHLRDVLRLKAKEEVIVFDDQGCEYITEIENLSSQRVILKIKEKKKNIMRAKPKITIACAIPKKSKLDDIIDKLTQLGVDRIIPLETERVIVNLDEKKKGSKLTRWRKIAQSSRLQSQRNDLPVIDPVMDLKEVLLLAQEFDLKLIPTLLGERKTMKEILQKSQYKNILIFIGPEGDFTQQEVTLARQAGCIPVSLGDLVFLFCSCTVDGFLMPTLKTQNFCSKNSRTALNKIIIPWTILCENNILSTK